MRFATQCLTRVDQLRFGIGPKNGRGAGVWVNDPDECNSDRERLLDLLVNLFLGIAGRQDLDHQHGHTVNERGIVWRVCRNLGGDVEDIGSDGDATSSFSTTAIRC